MKKSFLIKIRLFLILIVLISTSTPIHAIFESYNSYQFIIGERSAGMGGAMTAIVDDSTALWYNPAGLGNLRSSQINISATSYSYLSKISEGYWQANPGNGYQEIDMKTNDITVVPNSIIFAMKLGESNFNHAIAIGLFVPIQDTLNAGIDGTVAGPNYDVDLKSVYHVNNKYYSAMLGYGFKPLTQVSIGLASGFGYFLGEGEASLSGLLDQGGTNTVVAQYFHNEIEIFGIQASCGIQYKFLTHHHVGLTYKTPVYRISGSITEESIMRNVNTGGGVINDKEKTEKSFQDKPLPAIISLGYGYILENSWGISLTGDVVFPGPDKPNYAFNTKLGLEFFINNTSIVRTGFFTDFSQRDKITTTSSHDEKNDIYGFSASYSFAHNFKVLENNATQDKKIWTTLGLIYQIGYGEFRTIRFDENFQSDPSVEKHVFHRLSLFIAESVEF